MTVDEHNDRLAAAVRRDLLPENVLARASARILDGRELPPGLKDLTGLVRDVGLLLEEGATWLPGDDPAAASLRVEADRIRHPATRITELADTVEAPEGWIARYLCATVRTSRPTAGGAVRSPDS